MGGFEDGAYNGDGGQVDSTCINIPTRDISVSKDKTKNIGKTMKTRILPIAVGVAGFTALIGLFGHALQIDNNRPDAPQTVTVSQSEKEKAAIIQQHAITDAKLNTTIQASAADNTALRLKVQGACARLAKAKIVTPECQ